MLPQQMPVEITAYRLSGTQPCQNSNKSFLTGKSKYFNCFRTYKHDEAHRLVFRSDTKAVCVVHTPAFANLQYHQERLRTLLPLGVDFVAIDGVAAV